MKLFMISDLHLSFAFDKPMDIFGARWKNHTDRIKTSWTATVSDEDAVVIGGDVSWAISFNDVLPDLCWIDALPGNKKIILRGNHDYWWTTLQKMKRIVAENHLNSIFFLRNDALEVAGFDLCGTRGWVLPSDDAFKAEDQRIFDREVIRMNLSLTELTELRKRRGTMRPTIAVMHYPPISEKGQTSALSSLLAPSGIQVCLFGHIHHEVPFYSASPSIDGVRYVLTSADHLEFQPFLIGEDGVFQEILRL
ncbi:MAG: serine/threonine protein phosphatase [Clostridiaceae bacterium]|jgi:predicted phosphohydrolase|nr:serine/threonine protein phosphatase [Clostridiaceae bacterium]